MYAAAAIFISSGNDPQRHRNVLPRTSFTAGERKTAKKEYHFLRSLSEARESAEYNEGIIFAGTEVAEFVERARPWIAKAENRARANLKALEESTMPF